MEKDKGKRMKEDGFDLSFIPYPSSFLHEV